MGGIDGDVDAADLLHALGVRERHPGYARPEPARIDTQDQVTQIVVRVKPAIKLRRDISDGIGMFSAERIHHGYAVRQQYGVQVEVVIESEDLVGKNHHGLYRCRYCAGGRLIRRRLRRCWFVVPGHANEGE